MKIYFAPLEGLTDSIYRKLHRKYFPGVDKYFTPFFSPTVHRSLTPKEARELPRVDETQFLRFLPKAARIFYGSPVFARIWAIQRST